GVMDLTRLAVDAGQFINRAVQYTGESLGQAEKTELDHGLEELITRADATKTWTDQIISQTEVLLQPSPGARLEDRLYAQLEWSVPPRPRPHELLGDEMIQAGMEIGSNTPYGSALMRCGEAQKQLGDAEKQFVQSTNIHFLTPLRSFTEGEYRAIQDERKMLVNKRLDLDIAKTRLRKAHEADREARAEMELRICQSLFDRQSEITRRVLEGISNTHTNHMRCLSDFVDAQACYFAQCNQHAQELQKQLDSWTVNSPPKTEKNTRDPSLTALPTDPLNNNNNNNNNTFSTDGQTARHSSEINSLDLLCTLNQTPQLQPPSRTINTLTDAAPASSQTVTFSASAINGADSVTTAAASPPSQPSQTANAVTAESVTANEKAADPQTTHGTGEQPIANEEDVQESSIYADV
uniref:Endophilin-B1-like n=1 Tax=Acanthochromis polyacanthus TaxID=80966 RepID=A0A3Q1FN58_9TELE